MIALELNYAPPLYQQAYTEFKKLILTGQIAPGEKVVMSKLAEDYKISRTPLREALRQLQTEGLIVQDQTGMKIVELNKPDFLELYQCRILLEKEVIRSIVTIIPDSDYHKTDAVLLESKQAIEQGDAFRILELNTQFHELLIQHFPNKRMIELLNHVRSLLLLYRANINKKTKYNLEIYEEHCGILAAVKSRNVERAVQLMEDHLLNDQKRGLEDFS